MCNLHKAVGKRHHANEKDVKGNGAAAEEYVHLIKASVLLEAVGYQALLDDVDKVDVERGIHESEDDLFASIPDLVEMDVALADLKSGGDPDAKHADDGTRNDLSPEQRDVTGDLLPAGPRRARLSNSLGDIEEQDAQGQAPGD
ncbi:hypothetical protein HG530_008533 [Fusarium avenaceum]|nr:hypothetical protein HG530_008533 [Fusarium avenaceum]